MALTRLEAVDRVERIWGVTEVKLIPGWREVWSNDPGGWYVEFGSDHHTLDGNGHAYCHPACSQLEIDAYRGK